MALTNPLQPQRCLLEARKLLHYMTVCRKLCIFLLSFQSKAPSRILFDQICKQLHLLEVDYFGLEYSDLSNVTVRVNLSLKLQIYNIDITDAMRPHRPRTDNDD